MSIRSISFQRNIIKNYNKSALRISFSSKASNNETKPIFIHTYPGSRVLELSKANDGNLITYEVSAIIHNKLDSYVNNKAISAVFVTSESTELFSNGIDLENFQSLEQKKLTIDSVQKLARAISTYKKPILSVFNGLSNGSSFGTFAGSMVSIYYIYIKKILN
jgi:enoyl-CoA hydratase/carnithine racemase